MLEVFKGLTGSLRFRLVAAACLVLVLMLWGLSANSVRLLDKALLEREDRHLAELQLLHNISLAAPLAERDYAKLAQRVRQLAGQEGMRYLVAATTRWASSRRNIGIRRSPCRCRWPASPDCRWRRAPSTA